MTSVRSRSLRSLTLSIALLPGCGDRGRSPHESVAVRDSAGIEIVENRVALDELPEWRPGEPELRIGTLEGDPEYQLYRVRDATRLPDGRIVVVNSGTAEVRVYEPDGTFALSFGGEGEGPEGFGDIRGVDVVGDSLLAFDARSSRVSTWSTGGELLGSVTLSAPVGRLTGHAWLGGGLLLLDTPFDMVPEVGETIWWRLLVHRYARDGTLRDTIVEYPAMHLVRLSYDRGDGIMLSAFHFTPMAKVAAVSDRVFGTDASDREIEVLTSSGELRRLIRWTGPVLAVEDGDYETYRDEVLTALEDPESREETRDRLDRTPAEPAYPGLQDLGVAPDGSLWVRRYDRPGGAPGQRWLVFDTEGRLEGRVWLPDGLELHDVGHDYLIGVETDELDVEYVALYGFHPPWFGR